jgi:SRSO17 transposase
MRGEQIAPLEAALAGFLGLFRVGFARRPTFEHCTRYVQGLMAEGDGRKSCESIALDAGVAIRTMQEFLAQHRWDHERVNAAAQRHVADRRGRDDSVGVIDGSAHAKRGDKTPGVQRQYCGELGKVDNCVIGVHLLYTDNDPHNPFSAMLDSELYLPKVWADDAARRAEAGIPQELFHRPAWLIGASMVELAMSRGVRFGWLTFDEEYGRAPEFWFTLDALGQRAIGEVPGDFYCWTTPPRHRSLQGHLASKQVADVVRHSPAFTRQDWQEMTIKQTTRGPCVWRTKAARVQLTDGGEPTDRRYWLIAAHNPATDEMKYFVSNADGSTPLEPMLRAAWARWHVEKWFERAKQMTGFGDFEVRTHTGLLRHWLCSRLAMLFLADQTTRLRGEKPGDHVRTGGPGGRGDHAKDAQHLAGLLA